MPDFNNFPTDNSSSTNLKYDIIASKFMTGVENHRRRNALSSTSSFEEVFYLIGAVLELAAVTLMCGFILVVTIYKISVSSLKTLVVSFLSNNNTTTTTNY